MARYFRKITMFHVQSAGCCYMLISVNYVLKVSESVSLVQLFATLWTVGHQAPLSMGFSRQDYCSG